MHFLLLSPPALIERFLAAILLVLMAPTLLLVAGLILLTEKIRGKNHPHWGIYFTTYPRRSGGDFAVYVLDDGTIKFLGGY